MFDFLEEMYGKNRIIEEIGIGQSRADVLMVTEDCLFGIEIKSDADTYQRLRRQVLDYDQYFDYNIVVVGSSHAAHIREYVPEHWGIITVEIADGDIDFYYLRKPEENREAGWEHKIALLWRPELAKLQEYLEMPKYKTYSKAFVREKILLKIQGMESEERQEFQRRVCELLFERDYTTIFEVIQEYRVSENKPRRRKRRR